MNGGIFIRLKLSLGILLSLSLLSSNSFSSEEAAEYRVSRDRAQQLVSDAYSSYYSSYANNPEYQKNIQSWIQNTLKDIDDLNTDILLNPQDNKGPENDRRLIDTITAIPQVPVRIILYRELNPIEKQNLDRELQGLRPGVNKVDSLLSGSLLSERYNQILGIRTGGRPSSSGPGQGSFDPSNPNALPNTDGNTTNPREIGQGGIQAPAIQQFEDAYRKAGVPQNPLAGYGMNGPGIYGHDNNPATGSTFRDAAQQELGLASQDTGRGSSPSGQGGGRPAAQQGQGQTSQTPQQGQGQTQGQGQQQGQQSQQERDRQRQESDREFAERTRQPSGGSVRVNVNGSYRWMTPTEAENYRSGVQSGATDARYYIEGNQRHPEVVRQESNARDSAFRVGMNDGFTAAYSNYLTHRENTPIPPMGGRQSFGGDEHTGYTGGGRRGFDPGGGAYVPVGEGESGSGGNGPIDPRAGAAAPVGDEHGVSRGGIIDPRAANGSAIWSEQGDRDGNNGGGFFNAIMNFFIGNSPNQQAPGGEKNSNE